ncbi:MAG TPA: transglycosylase SLT domain-containing protein [Dissulfurispiraceae bacterium]|nr:transglycosylase SLT domain-containing protein [Dissulfurispiraceae bacterium]
MSPSALQQPAPQSLQPVAKTEQAKIPPLSGATVVPLPSTPADAGSAPQQCVDAPSTSASSEDGQVINVAITGNHSEVTYGVATAADVTTPEPELSTPPDNTTALAAIERNISLFAVRLRERFSVWLERSARYMEIMREILREKKLPEELVFLPFVESGFNVNAYSTAKAVGPWQFIEATAKRYGLVVDWWRDERRDPVKSTEAAAEYLSDLYSMFGSWHLALAAYNAGEGRIMRALKKTNADDYWSLLQTTQIRDETKEYVPRFFAAKKIAHSPEDFGFSGLDYRDPLEFDEVEIDRPLDIDVIARCSRASVTEIRELNPELRRWSTPPNVDRYIVRIPKGRAESFNDNLTQVPAESCFSYDVYVARKGDTVRKVASKVNVPVGALIALNDYTGFERLDAGDKVKIPPRFKFVMDSDDKASVKKASFSAQAGKQKSSRASGKSSKRGAGKTKDKIKARRI